MEIIIDDVKATQPHTLVGECETYIGTVKGSHITLKTYSHDDAEQERITEMGTTNFVIDDDDLAPSLSRIKTAIKLLELVEGESPGAFDYLKGALRCEQAIKSTHLCHRCYEYEEPDENCELCGGEGDYEEMHVIDWTTQKETLSLAFTKLLEVASHVEN
ncbi:hypothetical protein [Vibrio owensii]|uniref:hypothetical protein n=1 Tax=Vibrio owensii TaxID=696485 RepID=UPI003CE4B68E